MAFTGQDLDLDELGGLVTWSPAVWVANSFQYVVYLAEDAQGTGRSQVSTVPVGSGLREDLSFCHSY